MATQGCSHAPIHLSKSRFNATLRDGQAVRLPVDAFRSEAIHQVRKRGCAVSGDNLNTERVTDKLQIKLGKNKTIRLSIHITWDHWQDKNPQPPWEFRAVQRGR